MFETCAFLLSLGLWVAKPCKWEVAKPFLFESWKTSSLTEIFFNLLHVISPRHLEDGESHTALPAPLPLGDSSGTAPVPSTRTTWTARTTCALHWAAAPTFDQLTVDVLAGELGAPRTFSLWSTVEHTEHTFTLIIYIYEIVNFTSWFTVEHNVAICGSLLLSGLGQILQTWTARILTGFPGRIPFRDIKSETG